MDNIPTDIRITQELLLSSVQTWSTVYNNIRYSVYSEDYLTKDAALLHLKRFIIRVHCQFGECPAPNSVELTDCTLEWQDDF